MSDRDLAARHRDLRKWDSANSAAVNAMRLVLQTIDMDGVIVVGEGEKHSTPVLFHGEMVGTGHPPAVDVAVDPIEGTPARALGRPNTLALAALAEALKCKVSDLTVFVLDKPRHENLIRELNEAGARVKINSGGFIVGAMLAAMPGTGVDVMMSTGCASEAVLAACAVKAVDGGMQIRRAPQTAEEELRVRSALGKRADQILTEADVCKSEDVFLAATGITDGGLLHGVDFQRDGVMTESLVMRARSGTIRYVRAIHRLEKLMQFSQIDYIGDGYKDKDMAENHG